MYVVSSRVVRKKEPFSPTSLPLSGFLTCQGTLGGAPPSLEEQGMHHSSFSLNNVKDPT